MCFKLFSQYCKGSKCLSIIGVFEYSKLCKKYIFWIIITGLDCSNFSCNSQIEDGFPVSSSFTSWDVEFFLILSIILTMALTWAVRLRYTFFSLRSKNIKTAKIDISSAFPNLLFIWSCKRFLNLMATYFFSSRSFIICWKKKDS